MNYLLKLAFLTLLLCALAAVPYFITPLHAFGHTAALILIPGFALLTFLQHVYLKNSTKGSPSAFVRSFMGATVLKMLILTAAFIISLLLDVPKPYPFAGWFILTYISFTIYEVILLSKELSKAS